MYKKLLNVRVKDNGDMLTTNIQNFCRDDYEYMIVFLKFIDFFEFILFNEDKELSEDVCESLMNILEDTFIEEPIELVKYTTYFKRFCEMLEKPILEGMMTNE